jgi:hypothetical protein
VPTGSSVKENIFQTGWEFLAELENYNDTKKFNESVFLHSHKSTPSEYPAGYLYRGTSVSCSLLKTGFFFGEKKDIPGSLPAPQFIRLERVRPVQILIGVRALDRLRFPGYDLECDGLTISEPAPY